MVKLQRFRSAVRRLFPGKDPRVVLSRMAIVRLAEHRASCANASPETVLKRLVYVRSQLTEEQQVQMLVALKRDLGGEA